ncbi:MAG: hypothetical protein KAQ76_03250, partial [Elusimicrobiales bacterium]|nr:hypothetical protein [Elusimicrobiales bacterium]
QASLSFERQVHSFFKKRGVIFPFLQRGVRMILTGLTVKRRGRKEHKSAETVEKKIASPAVKSVAGSLPADAVWRDLPIAESRSHGNATATNKECLIKESLPLKAGLSF